MALTRAKVAATISYAEMRFKWGNMEFSRPSCFLREIDPKYIKAEFDSDDERPRTTRDNGDGPSAIDELRRRFDYRFQQKRQEGGGNAGGRSGYGGNSGGGYGSGNRSGDDNGYGSGTARRFARPAGGNASGGSGYGSRPQTQRPDPAIVQTPRPSTDGMRRLGARHLESASGPAEVQASNPAASNASGSGYAVGQRVEHPKFGVGIVRRIEILAQDHKLSVEFDGVGEKTLLAKFAKLTKL